MTRFADGGAFGSGVGVVSSNGSGGGTTTLEVNMNVGIAESQFAEVVAAYIKRSNGSREQIQAFVKSLENAGKGDPALAKLAQLLK